MTRVPLRPSWSRSAPHLPQLPGQDVSSFLVSFGIGAHRLVGDDLSAIERLADEFHALLLVSVGHQVGPGLLLLNELVGLAVPAAHGYAGNLPRRVERG